MKCWEDEHQYDDNSLPHTIKRAKLAVQENLLQTPPVTKTNVNVQLENILAVFS